LTTTFNIHQAKTHFFKLIERVRLGEEIVIAKAGRPVARLVPERRRRRPRQPGTGKGQIVVHSSFYDDLPDDLLDLFEGKSEAVARHAALLWRIDDDPRMSDRARALISHADTLVLSVASVGEIVIKAGLGQLEVPPDLQRYLRQQLARNEFELLPVLFEHAVAVRDLPHHHRDPFDRLLIAQSRVERLNLVSQDARMKAYDIDVLW
jgi:prevent-host-death family protein